MVYAISGTQGVDEVHSNPIKIIIYNIIAQFLILLFGHIKSGYSSSCNMGHTTYLPVNQALNPIKTK